MPKTKTVAVSKGDEFAETAKRRKISDKRVAKLVQRDIEEAKAALGKTI